MGNKTSSCDKTCQANIAQQVTADLQNQVSTCDTDCQANIAHQISGIVSACDAACRQDIATHVWKDQHFQIYATDGKQRDASASDALVAIVGNQVLAEVAGRKLEALSNAD